MIPKIVLHFDGGHMRPLMPEDIHLGYISGLNDCDVNRFLEVRHSIQTRESVLKFVQSNQEASNEVLFGVWQDEKKFHCGTLRLHGIKFDVGRAHIGICIFDKRAWGRRLGLNAISAATNWAISGLGLHWIEAGVYAENIASQKLFLAAGYEWICDTTENFVYEGRPAVTKIYVSRMTLS
jgi:RimJ/RimL family protein N-acetyltransferase